MRGILLLLCAAGTVAASACGSGGSPSPPAAGLASSLAREERSPDANFDYGFTVRITADGFHPRQLVAACCRQITWRNDTDRPEMVVLEHLLVSSGPIAPGGIFTFVPKNVESISYSSGGATAFHGAVQVNPTVGP